jgi:ribosomal protein S18 acetylase RimI-like enzyme
MTLSLERKRIRELVDDSDIKDAPSAYYALFHDPQKSDLHTAVNGDGKTVGFVGSFQTGQDLFRRLVTMKCQQVDVAKELLAETLVVGRHYLFFANLSQLQVLDGNLQLENERILEIYRLETIRFQPEINVMVVHKQAPNGTPRCEINSSGYGAVAGVNWMSPGFAEIYVQVDEATRGRGWGKSVVSALTETLLRMGRTPLYLVESNNVASRQLAEGVGFVNTGSRQVFADAIYNG